MTCFLWLDKQFCALLIMLVHLTLLAISRITLSPILSTADAIDFLDIVDVREEDNVFGDSYQQTNWDLGAAPTRLY